MKWFRFQLTLNQCDKKKRALSNTVALCFVIHADTKPINEWTIAIQIFSQIWCETWALKWANLLGYKFRCKCFCARAVNLITPLSLFSIGFHAPTSPSVCCLLRYVFQVDNHEFYLTRDFQDKIRVKRNINNSFLLHISVCPIEFAYH